VSDRPDPVEAARSFIAENYPWAVAAFLGGSAARGTTTETSDLDIIVIGAVASGRESTVHQGWPVELFRFTRDELLKAVGRDSARREPALATLIGEGVILASDTGAAEELQQWARGAVAAGPPPLHPAELAQRRYRITEALDDLRGGLPVHEAVFLAGWVLQEGANLVLAAAGRWEGRGKQAGRALRRLDPEREEAASAAMRALLAGDPKPLIAWTEAALDAAGGPLREGYEVRL
jgi:hypothetical protein